MVQGFGVQEFWRFTIWPFAAAVMLATATCVMAVVGASAGAQARTLTDDFSELADKLSASVVNISTTRNRDGQNSQAAPFGRQGSVVSLGSGFVVDPSGVIVTNNHVVRNATGIRITMTDGSEYQATVVGRDANTDIAILKVQPEEPLPAVAFGNSDSAKVGSWAMAIGNPFGFGGSVTVGIISARDRSIKGRPLGGSAPGRPQYFDFFIQTDAAINSGNSGGPLFNTKGEVIGINTAIISPTSANVGLAFAIPSSFAQIVVGQIRKYGEARLGYLGVSIQIVDRSLAGQVGLSRPRGVIVTQIQPNSPAQLGGLMPDDVILSFGGQNIDTLRRLPRLVAGTEIGAQVPVRVWRDGREVDLTVTIQRLPTAGSLRLSIAPPESRRFSSLGITLSELSLPMRIQHGLHASVNGLYVVDVDTDSPIAHRLKPGDLITDVYGWPVNNLKDMKARVTEAEKSDLGALLVKVNRKDETVFEAVKVSP